MKMNHRVVILPQRKDHQYPLNRRLGGPQTQSGCCGEEKNIFPMPDIKLQFLSQLANSLVTVLTEKFEDVDSCDKGGGDIIFNL